MTERSSCSHCDPKIDGRATFRRRPITDAMFQLRGFRWYVEGDSDRNTKVEVAFRRKGDGEWKDALPLTLTDFWEEGGRG